MPPEIYENSFFLIALSVTSIDVLTFRNLIGENDI